MTITLLHQHPDLVRFRALCDERRITRDPKERAVIARRIYAEMAPITEERDKLAAWLERFMGWLDEHPGHPQHAAREDTWLRRLHRYEAVCDALGDAREAVR